VNGWRIEGDHPVSALRSERGPNVGGRTSASTHLVAPEWRYSGNMPSVQIKSVPEDVHAELRRRAANEGKSLQEYLLGRLVEEARRPSLEDLLSRAGQRSGGHVSFRFASEAVREDRDAG